MFDQVGPVMGELFFSRVERSPSMYNMHDFSRVTSMGVMYIVLWVCLQVLQLLASDCLSDCCGTERHLKQGQRYKDCLFQSLTTK